MQSVMTTKPLGRLRAPYSACATASFIGAVTLALSLTCGQVSAQTQQNQNSGTQIAPSLNQPMALPDVAPTADPDIVAMALKSGKDEDGDKAPSITGQAKIAIAELNDKTDDVASQHKIELYKQLMSLNGTTQNLEMILKNSKDVTRNVVVERQTGHTLSPDDLQKYNEVSDKVLDETKTTLIDVIAKAQAKNFTEAEIAQLIKANSSLAVAKYTSGKFAMPESMNQVIQNYMVAAIIRIIKDFKGTTTS